MRRRDAGVKSKRGRIIPHIEWGSSVSNRNRAVRFKMMEIAIAEYISKKGMSKKGGSSRCPSHRVFGTTLAGNRSLSFRATLKRLELRAGAKRARVSQRFVVAQPNP